MQVIALILSQRAKNRPENFDKSGKNNNALELSNAKNKEMEKRLKEWELSMSQSQAKKRKKNHQKNKNQRKRKRNDSYVFLRHIFVCVCGRRVFLCVWHKTFKQRNDTFFCVFCVVFWSVKMCHKAPQKLLM